MKKILLLLLLTVTNIASAHKNITKFLDIPVDGSRTDVEWKLVKKGFSRVADSDVFQGRFNGQQVYVHITTNHDVVDRIMVSNQLPYDANTIKQEFNRLCEQFWNNSKYPHFADSLMFLIPADENVGYEMTVHNKQYEAYFYQCAEQLDEKDFKVIEHRILSEKFPEVDGSKPDYHLDMGDDYIKLCNMVALEMYSKQSVWFRINKQSESYFICIYYDNEYNRPHGEDL